MSHEPLLLQVQIQQIWLGEAGCCDASQRSILKVPFHSFPWPKERVRRTWKASAFLSFCPWNLKPIHCFLDYYCTRPVERHFRNKLSNKIRAQTLESEFWLNFLIFDLGQSLSTLNPNFFVKFMMFPNSLPLLWTFLFVLFLLVQFLCPRLEGASGQKSYLFYPNFESSAPKPMPWGECALTHVMNECVNAWVKCDLKLCSMWPLAWNPFRFPGLSVVSSVAGGMSSLWPGQKIK